jgi:hypothetical protein
LRDPARERSRAPRNRYRGTSSRSPAGHHGPVASRPGCRPRHRIQAAVVGSPSFRANRIPELGRRYTHDA